MLKENIKYQSETAQTMITAIRNIVQNELQNKKMKYDEILNNFVVSDCMQAASLRSMLNKEKEVVDALVSMYTQMLTMLENASNDIDSTEHTYSEAASLLQPYMKDRNKQ